MPATETRKPSLLDISDDLLALESLLAEVADNGGDITEAESTLEKWFAEIEADRDTKVDNYAALIRELELRADMRDEEVRRLTARRNIDRANASRLKARLQMFFEEHNLSKLETRRFKVSLVNNGGKIPVVVECSPSALPPSLQRVTIDADKDAIREAIEKGDTIDGCRLGERGRSIRIK